MKKLQKILTFVLLFLFIGIVNAEGTTNEPFKFDWKIENKYLDTYDVTTSISNTYYKNGYVTITSDYSDSNGNAKTYIRKYNVRGELQNTKILENKIISSLISNEQYIIAVSGTTKESPNVYEILLLDDSLNIKKTIEFNINDEPDILNMAVTSYAFKAIYGIEYLNLINNNVYFLNNDYITEINLETGKLVNYEYNDANFKKYVNNLYRLEEFYTDSFASLGYDKKNNYEVIVGQYGEGCTSAGIQGITKESLHSQNIAKSNIIQAQGCQLNGSIKLYSNDKLVFDKTYDNYYKFYDARLIDDYIVTIGTNLNISEDNNTIVILDMAGNIVQEISGEENYYYIVDGPTSFMVIDINDVYNSKCDSSKADPTWCYNQNNIVYYLPLNITTNIIGEGTINIVETARGGEAITYEVTPESGYELGTIKITDKKGNIIEYTTNTFTMPSSDVTIEVTFKKHILNPDTKDIALIVLLIMLVVGLIATLINYKKFKFLK